MGFSGSVNGTTKNPGFLDFGFCQCKWAYEQAFNFAYNMWICWFGGTWHCEATDEPLFANGAILFRVVRVPPWGNELHYESHKGQTTPNVIKVKQQEML